MASPEVASFGESSLARADILRIKDASGIVAIIEEYVDLKKVGVRFTGLCPFHKDRSPSFSVCPQRQQFKCFGCGETGDVFDFVQKFMDVGFYTALKTLADRAGIALAQNARLTTEERAIDLSLDRQAEFYALQLRGWKDARIDELDSEIHDLKAVCLPQAFADFDDPAAPEFEELERQITTREKQRKLLLSSDREGICRLYLDGRAINLTGTEHLARRGLRYLRDEEAAVWRIVHGLAALDPVTRHA